MKKEHLAVFLIILFTGILLRIVPAAREPYPIGYDNFFHARMAEAYAYGIPRTIPWPEERANLYPPSYHILILFLSILSGYSTLTIVRFLLPFLSMLVPIAVFFILLKFSGSWHDALIGLFLMTFNPFLLSAGYNSPEVICLFFSIIAFYFVYFKEKYILAGVFQAIGFSFSFFAGVYTSLLLLVLVFKKDRRRLVKFILPSLLFLLAWYGSRYDLLYQSNNVFGATFVFMAVKGWLILYAPFILGAVFPLLVMVKRNPFTNFWISWVVFFTVLYFSFLFTSYFHPWRLPLYISVGFVMLVATGLTNRSCWVLKVIFMFSFVLAVLLMLQSNLHSSVNAPDNLTMQWLDSMQGKRIMSEYSFCGQFLTLSKTNKTCNLDMYFESTPNVSRWIDYERMFWEYSPDLFRQNVREYSPDYIVYASRDGGRQFIEQSLNLSKVFISWSCNPVCQREAAVYVVNQ